MEGSIRKFIADRGFGFIATSGNSDVFFHISNVSDDDIVYLGEGQQVKFDTKETAKGIEAIRIEVI